ncbi:MAG: hypothetical protein MJ152_00300 [Clostridia bacterium]|nr:hypothetical protein [Clostridia bacterium]
MAEKINYQANFKINSGIFSNINEYVLDSVETSGKIDRNVIYRRWNIDVHPGETLDIFHMDEESIAVYFNLTKRFKYLMRANQILLASEENLEKIESNYATEMLEVVAKYPALKVIVEKDLKDIFTDKKEFLRIDKPNFSKTLNEVITQAVDQNLDALNEEDRKYFLSEKRHAQMAYNVAVAKEVQTAKLITKDTLTGEIINERQIVATRNLEQAQDVNVVAANYTKQLTKTEANAQNDEELYESVEKILKDKYGISAQKSMAKEATECNTEGTEVEQAFNPNSTALAAAPAEVKKQVVTKKPVVKRPVVKKPVVAEKDKSNTAASQASQGTSSSQTGWSSTQVWHTPQGYGTEEEPEVDESEETVVDDSDLYVLGEQINGDRDLGKTETEDDKDLNESEKENDIDLK